MADTDARRAQAERARQWTTVRWLLGAVTAAGVLALAVGGLITLQVTSDDSVDWPLYVALAAVVLVMLGLTVVVSRLGASLGRHYPPEEDRRTDEERATEENPRWSSVKALVVAALISSFVLALTVALVVYLRRDGKSSPEEALSVVFVAAAVVLILVVCTLTIVLKRLKLTDEREAMGLPRGSIRAVIALMLILLFFIAAIFLFNTTRRVPPADDELRVLQGVDETRLATIPTDQIYSLTRQDPDAQGVVRYAVTLLPSELENQTADDMAKQLITILGTLVTAIAAFYFGSNSVSSAIKGQTEAQTGVRTGGQPLRRGVTRTSGATRMR